MWGRGGRPPTSCQKPHSGQKSWKQPILGAGPRDGYAGSTFAPPCPQGALSDHPLADRFSVFSTCSESQGLTVSHTCLAVKNQGPCTAFLISHVSVLYHPSQTPRRATRMDTWAVHAQLQGHHSQLRCDRCPWDHAVWLLAMEETVSHTSLQPRKRPATLIKIHGLANSSPAPKYSVHGVWQAQGHDAQWSKKKSIL